MNDASVENLIESARRRSPESVELACWVCLATRVEPALLRRARLSLMPDAGAHAEADLWLGPLVQTRGSQYVMFYPEVSDRLRQQLVEGTSITQPEHPDSRVRLKTEKLLKAWTLIRQMHKGLLHLVRFEEELTWLALTASDEVLSRALDEHLRRVIKTILVERSSGLGHWALSVIPRLPTRARTKTTRILQMVSEAQLYGGWFSFDPETGEALSEEERALLLQSMEKEEVGVRLLGETLDISSPPREGAQKIYVPATDPLVVELSWQTNGETRGKTLRWESGSSASEEGVTTPLSVTTIIGDQYLIAERDKIVEGIKKVIGACVVCLLDRKHMPVGTGFLFRDNKVLTVENSLAGAVAPEGGATTSGASEVLLRFPLVPDAMLGEAPMRAAVTQTTGRAAPGDTISGLVLMSLDGRYMEWIHPVKLNSGVNVAGRNCVAFGYPPHAPEGGWIRFEVQDAIEEGRFPLRLNTEIGDDYLGSWAGAPVVDYAAGEMVGMLQLGYSPSDVKRHELHLITSDALHRAFPERLTDLVAVFVSSTWLDLEPERKAVEQSVQRLRETKYVGMEFFGSRDETTRRAALDEVDRSRVYVCIIAGRYGSGITEAEYRRARERGLPCFIYFKNEAAVRAEARESDPEKAERLTAFKEELRRNHIVVEFTTPDDLAARVTADIHRWLFDEYLDNPPLPVIPTLHQLRAPVSNFVGREKEIDELLATLRGGASATITGISGMGGIGKTELAFYVAGRLRDTYPDAQLVLDMRGTDDPPRDPADALAACIRAFVGVEQRLPDDLQELTRLYRNVLEGKRALIFLDNAFNSAQVRPLLPPAGSTLLITSRETIALPGMRRVTLEQLEPAEARELLTGIAPRVPADVADRISFLCGYLPLAIRAAGSLLDVTADLDPKVYAEQLQDERRRLEVIGAESVDLGVEASFGLSYARLAPDAARVFRRLSVFPGAFDAQAEEEMCEDPGHKHLSELLRRNLVRYNEETQRYSLHDLVRLFAGLRLSEYETSEGQWQHARHYLDVLREAERLYLRGGETVRSSLGLFDTEWRNISAGQAWAARRMDEDDGAKLCSEYALAATRLLDLRLQPRERINWLETGLAAARRLKQREAEETHLANLGVAYVALGQLGRAVELLEQALVISREISDRRGENYALGYLGQAYSYLGEPSRAVDLYEQQLTIAREIGDRYGEGFAMGNLGVSYNDLGEPRRAVEYFHQALAIDREIGDRRSEGLALGNLGVAYAALGETSRAVEFYEQQLTIAREIGDRLGEANALSNTGLALDELGDRAKAIAHVEAALEIFEQIESPHAERARAKLAQWRGQ